MTAKIIAAILLSGLSSICDDLKELNGEGGEDESETKVKRGRRAAKDSDDKNDEDEEKGSRRGRRATKEEDEDEEDTDEGDVTTEDLIKAMKVAIRATSRIEVRKLIKKFGKADEIEDVSTKNAPALLKALKEAAEA